MSNVRHNHPPTRFVYIWFCLCTFIYFPVISDCQQLKSEVLSCPCELRSPGLYTKGGGRESIGYAKRIHIHIYIYIYFFLCTHIYIYMYTYMYMLRATETRTYPQDLAGILQRLPSSETDMSQQLIFVYSISSIRYNLYNKTGCYSIEIKAHGPHGPHGPMWPSLLACTPCPLRNIHPIGVSHSPLLCLLIHIWYMYKYIHTVQYIYA